MIHIRPEKTEDIVNIDELTRLAFGGEDEVKLIKALRASDYFIPEFSLAAAQNLSQIILNTVEQQLL